MLKTLAIIFLVIFISRILFRFFFRMLFSGNNSRRPEQKKREDANSDQYAQQTHSPKKFGKNEGEYISYEEVKDDE